MYDLATWAAIGTLCGILFGIIPGAGPFIAIAVLYPFLTDLTPVNIMMCYVSILIATNYTNSVTAILYGIPGDAAAISTAVDGHRLYRKGFGAVAISSNAIASTIGVAFACLAFILVLPNIMGVFRFYNSIVQSVIISLAIILIVGLNKQNKLVSVLLFSLGAVMSQVGYNNVTFESVLTFGNPYLGLGIPFSAVMTMLYIWPEVLKMKFSSISPPALINRFAVGRNTLIPSLLGSFIGFWSGLIPGVTNILGSYASAKIVKRYFRLPVNKSISAAEAANNSGALSSLLPLLILAIPITGSEVIVYYLMMGTGYQFNAKNTIDVLYNIIYVIPFVTLFCLYVSWHEFNLLGKVAYFYKNYKNYANALLLTTISLLTIMMFPFKVYIIICLLILMVLGYTLRRWDTSPIIYGYFLGDLFYESLIRTFIILS